MQVDAYSSPASSVPASCHQVASVKGFNMSNISSKFQLVQDRLQKIFKIREQREQLLIEVIGELCIALDLPGKGGSIRRGKAECNRRDSSFTHNGEVTINAEKEVLGQLKKVKSQSQQSAKQQENCGRFDHFVKRQKELSDEVEKVKGDKNSVVSENRGLRKQLAQLSTINENKTKEIRGLVNKIDKLSKAKERDDTIASTATARVSSPNFAETTKDSRLFEVKQLQEKLATCNKKIQKYKATIQDNQKNIESQTEKIQKLKATANASVKTINPTNEGVQQPQEAQLSKLEAQSNPGALDDGTKALVNMYKSAIEYWKTKALTAQQDLKFAERYRPTISSTVRILQLVHNSYESDQQKLQRKVEEQQEEIAEQDLQIGLFYDEVLRLRKKELASGETNATPN